MPPSSNSQSKRENVRAHRERLRAEGLRPVQMWLPDVRLPGFRAEASRQSRAVATSACAEEDQSFMESVSDFGPA